MTARVPAPSRALVASVTLVFLILLLLEGIGGIAFGTPTDDVVDTAVAVVYFGTGLVAWRLRPANWTGPLLVATGVLMVPHQLAGNRGDLPDAIVAVGWVLFGGVQWIPMALLLLTFPFGKLARTDRWVLGAVMVNVTIQAWIWLPFRPGAACDDCPPMNPLAFAADREISAGFATADMLIGSAIALAVFTRAGRRFRTGSPPARRAMAPVLWSGLPIPLALVGTLTGLIPYWILYSVTALIPLGFLAGLLRTRVTRSVVGDLVVALAKAPPPEELRGLLARALGDPSLRLAFRSASGVIDASGAAIEPGPGQVTTELPEAVLFHDPALLDDEGLVETVAAAARLALENARLQAEVRAQLEEVRASRARVVESADAERRRIERDLHDGAQQQLLGLAISLRLLREELGDEAPPGASALLEQASAEARQTLVEMRELARGIHPPVLVNDGLGPALHSLAERAAIPVLVEAAPENRLPSHTEVAAWFVCNECVANAVKHSHAGEIRISAVERGDELRLRIADDGIGGASPATGGGLSGLRDRVEALGGTLEVDSAVGRGTVVTAALPLARERFGADAPA